jgi:hypothetical protein
MHLYIDEIQISIKIFKFNPTVEAEKFPITASGAFPSEVGKTTSNA